MRGRRWGSVLLVLLAAVAVLRCAHRPANTAPTTAALPRLPLDAATDSNDDDRGDRVDAHVPVLPREGMSRPAADAGSMIDRLREAGIENAIELLGPLDSSASAPEAFELEVGGGDSRWWNARARVERNAGSIRVVVTSEDNDHGVATWQRVSAREWSKLVRAFQRARFDDAPDAITCKLIDRGDICSGCTSWGLRHLRAGHLTKAVREEGCRNQTFDELACLFLDLTRGLGRMSPCH